MGEEPGDKVTGVCKNSLSGGWLWSSQWWCKRRDMKGSNGTNARSVVLGSADTVPKVTGTVRDGRHPEIQSVGQRYLWSTLEL